jgi:hypothetical protein
MNRENLRSIAEQAIGGKKFHEIDFGMPGLTFEEKLNAIDQALRQYPTSDVTRMADPKP